MSVESSAARPLTLVDGGDRPVSAVAATAANPGTGAGTGAGRPVAATQTPAPALTPTGGFPPVPREDELDRLTQLARRVFDVPMVTIALPGPAGSHRDRAGATLAHPDAFHRATLDCPSVLLVPDARTDPRFARHRSVVGAPQVRFYAGRRLIGADGRPVGVLSLRDTRVRLISDAHLLLLEEIGGWIEQELARSAGRAALSRVHASLLPRDSPVLPGFDLAAASVLAGGLGAGFFDWYPGPDPHPTGPAGAGPTGAGPTGTATALGWSLADVMGSPAATAVVAAGLRGALRAHGVPALDDPASTVEAAAAVIADDLESTSTFATLIAGRIEVGGAVALADAGHGLALLIRADGGCEHLTTGALPLGIGDRTRWPTRSLQLERGDTLLVFTEGLLGLYDGTLASLRHVETLVRGADRARDVVDRVRALTRRRGSTTDVTVLVAHRLGGPATPDR